MKNINTNKVVWVSGASKGIGKATAMILLHQGYTVYAADSQTETMKDLKHLGAHLIEMDLADDSEMQSAIDEIIANEGRIDVLINNAEFGLLSDSQSHDLEAQKEKMRTTVFGMTRLMQLALPYMKKQNSGTIININPVNRYSNIILSEWHKASTLAIEILSASVKKQFKTFGVEVMLLSSAGIPSQWHVNASMNINEEFLGKTYGKMAQEVMGFQKKETQGAKLPETVAIIILDTLEELQTDKMEFIYTIPKALPLFFQNGPRKKSLNTRPLSGHA